MSVARPAAAIDGVAVEFFRHNDHGRVDLGVALVALDLLAGGALAAPSLPELGNRHGLVELGYGPEDLPHELRGGRIV